MISSPLITNLGRIIWKRCLARRVTLSVSLTHTPKHVALHYSSKSSHSYKQSRHRLTGWESFLTWTKQQVVKWLIHRIHNASRKHTRMTDSSCWEQGPLSCKNMYTRKSLQKYHVGVVQAGLYQFSSSATFLSGTVAPRTDEKLAVCMVYSWKGGYRKAGQVGVHYLGTSLYLKGIFND